MKMASQRMGVCFSQLAYLVDIWHENGLTTNGGPCQSISLYRLYYSMTMALRQMGAAVRSDFL